MIETRPTLHHDYLRGVARALRDAGHQVEQHTTRGRAFWDLRYGIVNVQDGTYYPDEGASFRDGYVDAMKRLIVALDEIHEDYEEATA